jgi:hypothetical protein
VLTRCRSNGWRLTRGGRNNRLYPL